MKLTKNLLTIVSSLWTSYSIKKTHMRTFALMWHLPPPVRIRLHSDGPPFPPKCERNNWMPPIRMSADALFLPFFTDFEWILSSSEIIFLQFSVNLVYDEYFLFNFKLNTIFGIARNFLNDMADDKIEFQFWI